MLLVIFCRNIKLSFTFTRCTFEESFIAKVSIQWGRNFSFLVILFMKNKSKQELSHSAKCTFCPVRCDQSCCCQTAVRKCRCCAPMPSPCCNCSPRGLNRHPGRCKGSHAELFRYASLTEGWILGTSPAEASRELSQMFLGEEGGEVSTKYGWILESFGTFLRPTHEGVARGQTLMRSAIVVRISLLHGWVAVTLVGGAMMETGIVKLHQDSGGAEVKGLGEEVVPPFRVGKAAVVGVHADGPLFHGTAWR